MCVCLLGNGLTKKISLPWVTLPEIIMLIEDIGCLPFRPTNFTGPLGGTYTLVTMSAVTVEGKRKNIVDHTVFLSQGFADWQTGPFASMLIYTVMLWIPILHCAQSVCA